ncbi:MAG: chaperonin GroEL [Planctomycetes bacterium]|nr:chaperonin GroEL [Planctomycetota bacterium]
MPKQPKQIVFDLDTRQCLMEGVQKIARAVKTTLGPIGHCALIDRGWGEPLVTKDGASVAEQVELTNPYENMAARLVREAAEKTSDEAGDGSTTTAVLAESIFRSGMRQITAGVNPMVLCRGVRAASDQAVQRLTDLSVKIKDNSQLLAVATVAANNDREIGKTLTDALEKVGRDGVITIEEGKGIETTVEVVEGMEFDRGFLSPYFVTDPDKMVCELKDPYILIMEEKISTLPKILPVLERVYAQKKSLFIIAEDVEGEVLSTLVVNKLKGVLSCAAVKAPGYGDRRKALLGDLAILTGGTAIMKDLGLLPEKIRLEMLGRAKKVIITSEKTTILEGGGKEKDIEAREAEIRKELEGTTSDYDREKLQERLAKLVGGVAVIKVGAATESEMKERKGRFESALSATRAAIEEGVLPGGGVALFRVAEAMVEIKTSLEEERIGFKILRKALESPIRQLIANASLEPGDVLREIRKKKGSFGYDLVKAEYGDLLEAGILDSTKVTRIALQNAVSVATLLLTTDALVANVPKEEEEVDPHHHHHDEGGMEDF